MSTATKVVLCLTVLALAGCGGGDSEKAPGDIAPVDPSVTESAPAPAPEPASHSRSYDLAKQVCDTVGARGLAKTYGGDPSAPSDVAQHYAQRVFRPDAQPDAVEGCLAGLGA